MTKKEIEHITNQIEKQKGLKYPVSNQVINCALIGYKNDWNNFVRSKKVNAIKISQYDILLNNGERWCHIPLDSNFRGCRFYKLIVNKKIDRSYFFKVIYPYCSMYCCDIEWI